MRGDLHTARLRLRPLSPADEALYCSLYGDPQVMRHVAAPLAREAVERAFTAVRRHVAADPPLAWYWILAARSGDGDLGLLACVPDREDRAVAEVGVLLLPAAACRGFAAEAIAAVAGAFFATGGRRLWTRHARGNGPAAGLMHKLGFAPADGAADGATLRWELAREAWPSACGAAFASPRPNC